MTKTIKCRRRAWFDDHICRTTEQILTLNNCRDYFGTLAGYTPAGDYVVIAAADVLEVIS